MWRYRANAWEADVSNATTTATVIEPIDDELRFREMTRRPSLAWPTLLLLVAVITLFAASTTFYLTGYLGLAWAIMLNAMACYMAFTVGHDASHNAVSSNRRLNDWVGRISTMLLSPIPFFRMFRYIHMQHHRFTNEDNKDPDMYCGKGSKWTLPLRWATLDIHYFTIYLKPGIFLERPVSERRELVIAALFGVATIAFMIGMGWGLEYFLLFFVPTRIAVVILACAFDFLPHYPHATRASEDPFQATLNRKGWEWILTPLLLSQNYHLVHHLYPTVPFYRYLSVWRAREAYHQSHDPAQASAFGLGPV